MSPAHRPAAQCLPPLDIQVTGVAIATNGGFAYPSTVPGTAGSIYAGPNFRFLDQSKNPATVTNLVHGIPYTNTLPAYSLQYFVVQVPSWATRATNVLEFADQVQTTNPLPSPFSLTRRTSPRSGPPLIGRLAAPPFCTPMAPRRLSPVRPTTWPSPTPTRCRHLWHRRLV